MLLFSGFGSFRLDDWEAVALAGCAAPKAGLKWSWSAIRCMDMMFCSILVSKTPFEKEGRMEKLKTGSFV